MKTHCKSPPRHGWVLGAIVCPKILEAPFRRWHQALQDAHCPSCLLHLVTEEFSIQLNRRSHQVIQCTALAVFLVILCCFYAGHAFLSPALYRAGKVLLSRHVPLVCTTILPGALYISWSELNPLASFFVSVHVSSLLTGCNTFIVSHQVPESASPNARNVALLMLWYPVWVD